VIAGPNGAQGRGPRPRRSFSARARQAASLHARGYSRKETAGILGVAPETVSVWKRHPNWQLEVDRWRALADGGLDRQQLALNSAALRATSEALEQLQLIMTTATKRVRTSSGLTEQPDWATRLRACRLLLALSVAAVPELYGQARPDRRIARIGP
jgi:predicted transcriptional regulator